MSDLHRKLMFGNLPVGKHWGQFTKIFVSGIALFCILDPIPKPFVAIWRIRKHEFHAVLYISCNFHKEIVLSDMAQCLSHWVKFTKHSISGEFWAFHAIPSNILSELGQNTHVEVGE